MSDFSGPRPLRVATKPLSARLESDEVSATAARLISSGSAVCVADICRLTGLARSTVSSAVASLLSAGAIQFDGVRPTAGRGRPADRLRINPAFGHVLYAEIGSEATKVALFDLAQNRLGFRILDLKLMDDPAATLAVVIEALLELAEGTAPAMTRCLVVSIPGPVDHELGYAVRPQIMPGWDHFPVMAHLRDALGCDVIIENDANLCALGEARSLPETQLPLIYVMVDKGIGCGIVDRAGELFVGAGGSAGDIGHMKVGGSTRPCVCGRLGCLEAVSSGAAIWREIHDTVDVAAVPACSVSRLSALLKGGDPRAMEAVHTAADAIGEAVANLVQFYNPARVVVGGALAESTEAVLTGIRRVVFSSATGLAARNLVIDYPVLADDSGAAGAAIMGTEWILRPSTLRNTIRSMRMNQLDRSARELKALG